MKTATHYPVVWVAPLGLLTWPAFPPLEWAPLAWVALTPLVLGLHTAPGTVRSWFQAGWGYGLVYFGLQFAWLRRPLLDIAHIPPLSFLGFMLVLVGALALVPALTIGLSRWIWTRWEVAPLWSLPILLAGGDALLDRFPFGGVAWGSLAGTQPHTLAARVLAPWVGGPGLVLALGLVNAGWAWSLAPLLHRLRKRPAENGGNPKGWYWRSSAAMLLMAGLTLLATWPGTSPPIPPQTRPDRQHPRPFTALLVPGAVSLPRMMAQYNTPDTLRYYLGRTLAALEGIAPDEPGPGESLRKHHPATPGATDLSPAHGPPVLAIWPESAVSGEVARGKILVELNTLATAMGMDLLLGSGARELGREYNSVYLLTAGPFDFSRYDKRQLVPFGEYVPRGFRWLFGRKVTAGEEDYTAGSAPPVLDWRGRRLGIAVCFESILPAHLRRAVRDGAEVIVAMANDEWLTPSASREHLLLSALRGLEVGRDVLFVSNGGWTALLRDGQALALTNDHGTPFRVRPLLNTGLTPWVRRGYLWLSLLCLAVAALGLLGRRTRRTGKKEALPDPLKPEP